MFENRIVACNKIEFETRTDQTLRTCSQEFACELAVSIKQEGLFHPIVIRPNLEKPGFFKGVQGRHRFYAVHEVLKNESIECRIVTDMDEPMAEMATIAENLWRYNLSPAQRALGSQIWYEHFAAKNPEKVRDGNPETRKARAAKKVEAKVNEKAGHTEFQEPEATSGTNFAKSMAAARGRSLASAKRDQRIGKSFTADQMGTFHKKGTTQSDMLKIAKVADLAQRAEVVDLVADGVKVPDAVRQVLGDAALEKADSKPKADPQAQPEVTEAQDETIRAQTDEEWYQKECGDQAARITDPRKFKADALLYRHVNEDRHVFRRATKAALKSARVNQAFGPLQSLVKRMVHLSHPKDWLLCGTCGGRCLDTNAPEGPPVECPKCFGAGYFLKREASL
jgi:hypothetical protein